MYESNDEEEFVVEKKKSLSFEAKQYRKECLNSIIKRMSEDNWIVLAMLWKKRKQQMKDDTVVIALTIDSIVKTTGLSGAKVRDSMKMFYITNFANKEKQNNTWLYSITDDGYDAFSDVCDSELANWITTKIKLLKNEF